MRYTDPLIELSGLCKRFGDQQVLSDLDLTLPHGVHALLGPNGAGKTTLVNILSTLTTHDAGDARVLGLALPRDTRSLRGLISLTGQYAALDERLSGTENLVMMGRLFGLSRREATRRGDELLERFELTQAAGKRVITYSGGMRRKLDLAVSLIAHPRLIFLDEPTTGLDTRSRQALWDEITTLAASGTSIVLTTQYLEEADVLAERIAVLNDGRIVAEGTASQLKDRIGTSTICVHDEHGRVVEERPTHGSATDVARVLTSLAAERPDAQVTVRRPTLDEVFLELTGQTTSHDADEPEPAPASEAVPMSAGAPRRG